MTVTTRKTTKERSSLEARRRTEPHESSHWRPNSVQALAVEALAVGKRDEEAAQVANVARETVCRWRHNGFFAAALDQRRKELWQVTHDQARGLAGRALGVLEDALDNPTTAMAAAAQVLKVVKLDVGSPDGETDPEARLHQDAATWAEAELRHRGEWLQDDIDQMLATFSPAKTENERRLAELAEKRLAQLLMDASKDLK